MEIRYPEHLEFEKATKKQLSMVKAIANSIAKENGFATNAVGDKFTSIIFEFKPEWATSAFEFEYNEQKIKAMPKWLVSGFIGAFEHKILAVKKVVY